MNFTEQIKGLVERKEIRDASINLLEDTVNALLGDDISAGKIMIAITKSPFFIREQMFWVKLEAFLNGVFLNDEDRAKLRAKLTEAGTNCSNPYRLVECIDRAETKQKIRYLINATRCLLTDFIDLTTYFRICHAITNTLEEDLRFLRDHITESDLSYDQFTQGLLTAGLMYQSVIDSNGEQKYSFTPIAKDIDQFAVSYDDDARYPNPTLRVQCEEVPNTSISSLEWQPISGEE